jgi:hypothetical protein
MAPSVAPVPEWEGKTLDLVVGIAPRRNPPTNGPHSSIDEPRRQEQAGAGGRAVARLLIACEMKSVLTEHGKVSPASLTNSTVTRDRPWWQRDTVAAGLTLVNISATFSGLRRR